MAKTDTPFFSMGSQGSIGKVLTSQKRGSKTLLRAKPEPTDLNSLAQQAHRSHYLFYSTLWRAQPIATREAYRALCSKTRLTPYQYWMKEHLSAIPDYRSCLYLFAGEGQTARDYSAYDHSAVIYGLTWDTLYPPLFSFGADGVNDYLDLASPAHLQLSDNFTYEFWAYWEAGDFFSTYDKSALAGTLDTFVEGGNMKLAVHGQVARLLSCPLTAHWSRYMVTREAPDVWTIHKNGFIQGTTTSWANPWRFTQVNWARGFNGNLKGKLALLRIHATAKTHAYDNKNWDEERHLFGV